MLFEFNKIMRIEIVEPRMKSDCCSQPIGFNRLRRWVGHALTAGTPFFGNDAKNLHVTPSSRVFRRPPNLISVDLYRPYRINSKMIAEMDEPSEEWGVRRGAHPERNRPGIPSSVIHH